MTDLFNLEETIAIDLLKELNYPWEAISKIHDFIYKLGENLNRNEYNYRENDVWVHKSAKVYESACIKGPAIICADSEIRHCAFIRGDVIIGKGSVIGNSTEIKNSILFNEVQVPHYNYVGDSILGYKSHMGAGAIISNIKSDKTSVIVDYKGVRIDTKLRKLGAIVGDNVEIGCNSVLNPGTIIERNSNIYPLSMVRGTVKKSSIYKNKNEIVKKFN